MLYRKRRPLRCYRRLKAARMKTNDINLPFAENHFALLGNKGCGLIKPEKNIRLLENQCLWRIYVFPGIFILNKLTPRKRHHSPLPITNGKHETSTESVIAAVSRPVWRLDHTCRP